MRSKSDGSASRRSMPPVPPAWDVSSSGPSADVRIMLRPAPSVAELEQMWRSLEARANCSFFQSWTYTGCLIEERFTDAVLLAAYAGDILVALALFNRRRGSFRRETILLGESGNPSLDAVFIEHNGPLVDRNYVPDLLPRLLRAMVVAPVHPSRARRRRRVVLSGVGDALLAAARAGGVMVAARDTRIAPFIDLAVDFR